MTFEVFTRKNLHGSVDPTVTVTARNGLSLNRAAFEALDKPVFVQLLLDRGEGLCGIKVAPMGNPDAYWVNPQSRSINAIAFTRYAGLSNQDGVARRWDAMLDEGVLSWDASKPGTPVTSNRAKNSA